MDRLKRVLFGATVVAGSFALAHVSHEEVSILCTRRAAQTRCQLEERSWGRVHGRMFGPGELVSAGYTLQDHRDDHAELYVSRHLVLRRADGSSWTSDDQSEAEHGAQALTSFLAGHGDAALELELSNLSSHLYVAAVLSAMALHVIVPLPWQVSLALMGILGITALVDVMG